MVDWYKRSHEGRRIIDDNKRSGRQTKEESDIHNVKAVVLLDIRKPINEIADTVGMIHGTVYNIVTNNYKKN